MLTLSELLLPTSGFHETFSGYYLQPIDGGHEMFSGYYRRLLLACTKNSLCSTTDYWRQPRKFLWVLTVAYWWHPRNVLSKYCCSPLEASRNVSWALLHPNAGIHETFSGQYYIPLAVAMKRSLGTTIVYQRHRREILWVLLQPTGGSYEKFFGYLPSRIDGIHETFCKYCCIPLEASRNVP